MAHHGIFGRTESGKTTLAKIHHHRIRQLIVSGQGGNIKGTAILQPLGSRWEGCDFQTSSAKEMQAFLAKYPGYAVFVEECGLVNDCDPDLVTKWLTTYRHMSHSFYFVGVRHKMLVPNQRNMFKSYFVFCSTYDEDRKEMAQMFGKPQLLEAHSLPNGEFYWASYSFLYRGKINFAKQTYTLKAV